MPPANNLLLNREKMKDKRKEILRDLLGEFGSDEEKEEEIVEEEEYPLPRKEREPPVPEEEEKFTLDQIMKKTPQT